MLNKKIIGMIITTGLLLTGCSSTTTDTKETEPKETIQIVRCAECKNEMKETEDNIFACVNPSCDKFIEKPEEKKHEAPKKEEVKKNTKEKVSDERTCYICKKSVKKDAGEITEAEKFACYSCLEETERKKQEFFKQQENNRTCIDCGKEQSVSKYTIDVDEAVCDTCMNSQPLWVDCYNCGDTFEVIGQTIKDFSPNADYECLNCEAARKNSNGIYTPCYICGRDFTWHGEYHSDGRYICDECENSDLPLTERACNLCGRFLSENERQRWIHDGLIYCPSCLETLQADVHPEY